MPKNTGYIINVLSVHYLPPDSAKQITFQLYMPKENSFDCIIGLSKFRS